MIRTDKGVGRRERPRTFSAPRTLLPLAVLLALEVPQRAWADSQSPFTPASPNAAAISTLFVTIIVIAAIIFVGVEGVLFYSLFRHRHREDRAAAQFTGNTRLEIIWTAIPALILAVVFYLTARTVFAISAPPTADPLDINVTAHQWWWQVDYPNDGVATANDIHVPVGETVVIHLRTADVIHSFWVPSLAPKWDAIPGAERTVWFIAQQPGIYRGNCAEFCGISHTWMQFQVEAQSPSDYAAWIQAQRRPAALPSGLAARGQQIYQSQTCGNCHAITGTSPSAVIGPNLTHVGSRPFIGGGVLPNTPQNMSLWLQDPQAVKPGVLMPNYRFSAADVTALSAYMESLK